MELDKKDYWVCPKCNKLSKYSMICSNLACNYCKSTCTTAPLSIKRLAIFCIAMSVLTVYCFIRLMCSI